MSTVIAALVPCPCGCNIVRRWACRECFTQLSVRVRDLLDSPVAFTTLPACREHIVLEHPTAR